MPTNVVPYVHMINPETLGLKTKQELWTGIKALDPALADLMTNDPNISALKNTFGATIRFTEQNLNRYVAEGKKILEERKNVRNQLLQNHPIGNLSGLE